MLLKNKSHTLRSVADKLNVSTATISNAFNRPDQLSKVKREEILFACKQLGYLGPNKAAQSLRRGRSGIIALVLADSIDYMISDPVASSFIRGVSEIVKDNGSHLLLFSGSSPSINSVIDFVDGFICYGTPRNTALFQELERCPKKVITVDFEIPERASVGINNHQAAYEIALQALSPDDTVAIVGLRITNAEKTSKIIETDFVDVATSVGFQRYKGYQDAMAKHGLQIDTSLVWSVPESTQAYAKQAAEEILNEPKLPNTILCMSDLIALSILKELLSAGVKVPEQVKIVGFDGIEETKRYHPILSTVYQNSTEKGRMAAHLFNSKDPKSLLLDYQIFCGESC
ncbi:MAG: HTH-type transcriptional repressor CytR [Glaciecola sp. HTCC2999]|nr:MAG: HTH-type transcriptional repressor CytR [Glaciecola sp. HTCC2999]